MVAIASIYRARDGGGGAMRQCVRAISVNALSLLHAPPSRGIIDAGISMAHGLHL